MRITSWEPEWEEEREARTGLVVLCVGSVFHGGEWQIRLRLRGYWSDAVAQACWWKAMNDSVCPSSKDKLDKMTCSRSVQLVFPFDYIACIYTTTEMIYCSLFSKVWALTAFYVRFGVCQLGVQLIVNIIYLYQTQPFPTCNCKIEIVPQFS